MVLSLIVFNKQHGYESVKVDRESFFLYFLRFYLHSEPVKDTEIMLWPGDIQSEFISNFETTIKINCTAVWISEFGLTKFRIVTRLISQFCQSAIRNL